MLCVIYGEEVSGGTDFNCCGLSCSYGFLSDGNYGAPGCRDYMGALFFLCWLTSLYGNNWDKIIFHPS